MKKILPILLVVALSSSCRKDYCWECNTEITTLAVSAKQDSVETITNRTDILCNRTEKEIRSAEKENSFTRDTIEGDLSIHRVWHMQCKKQD